VEHRRTEFRQAAARGTSGDDAARFLRELRQLRSGAGLGHAELAARTHYPDDQIRAAEAGPALPDLPVLAAYVQGCGGTTEEWEERWRTLHGAPAQPVLLTRSAGCSGLAARGARIGAARGASGLRAVSTDPSPIIAAFHRVAEDNTSALVMIPGQAGEADPLVFPAGGAAAEPEAESASVVLAAVEAATVEPAAEPLTDVPAEDAAPAAATGPAIAAVMTIATVPNAGAAVTADATADAARTRVAASTADAVRAFRAVPTADAARIADAMLAARGVALTAGDGNTALPGRRTPPGRLFVTALIVVAVCVAAGALLVGVLAIFG
jgi:Helix-turn-helix domain